MRTKSSPIRFSRNRIEKSEGCEEMVTDTCEISGKGRFEFDACIVCEVSDRLVSRCSGADCPVSFHGECLTCEFGGSDDLSNPFCPYCWFKFVSLKSKSLREKAIEAEKAVLSYLDKDMNSKDSEKSDKLLTEETEEGNDKVIDAEDDDETANVQAKVDTCLVKKGDVSRFSSLREHGQVLQNEKHRRRRRKRVELNVGTDDSKPGDMEEDEVNIEKLQDAEDDDETAIVLTKVKSGAVESYSGKEHGQVQEHEKQSKRRRSMVVLSDDDTDSEISSTKEEENGEDVTEQITPSRSGNTKNQQRQLSEATKSNTPREVSFFRKDQRRRLLWTSEEEDMLKVGVEKFAEANKNIPWRKILKWGENVFHKTRSSADLKDKWRNMIKLM